MADSLDIFNYVPLTDSRIRKYELEKFLPAQAVNMQMNSGKFDFDSRGAPLDALRDLHNAYFLLGVVPYKADKNTVATTSKTDLVQNIWSIFTRAELRLGGVAVDVCDEPAMTSMLKNFIWRSRDEILSQGPAEGFFPQSVITTDITPAAASASTNGDLLVDRCAAKYNTFAAETPIFFKLPLRDILPFCEIKKYLYATPLKIQLQTQTDFTKVFYKRYTNPFGRDNGADPPVNNPITAAEANADAEYLRIHTLELHIPQVRTDAGTFKSIIDKAREGDLMPFEYESMRYQRHNIEHSSTKDSVVLSNFTKRPSAVVVYMQYATDESNASYSAPGRMKGRLLGLEDHKVHLDGKVYPEGGFNGKIYDYVQEYDTYLSLSGKQNDNLTGAFLDKQLWKDQYPVLCYNLENMRNEFGAVYTQAPAMRWEAKHAAPYSAAGLGTAPEANTAPTAYDAVAHILICGKEYITCSAKDDVLKVDTPEYSD